MNAPILSAAAGWEGKGDGHPQRRRAAQPYGAVSSRSWWLSYGLEALMASLVLVLGTFVALRFSVLSILLGKNHNVP